MNIIFHIDGGVGKCIAATAVLKGIRKKYSDSQIIVTSGYPDVFLNNPNVDKTFAFGQESYFYEKYLEVEDAKVFAHNPYMEAEHIQRKEHLIETWFRLCGLEYEGELPEFYSTKQEIKFYEGKFSSEKPLLVFQPFGGSSKDIKYSWCRDLPFDLAQRFVNEHKEKYNVVHIKREDQPKLENAIPISDNIRGLAVLFQMSEKRLLIDSFGQHLASALKLPSTVCWIGNSSKVFGYDIHNNIQSNTFTKKPELKQSYLGKFNIEGDPLEFPYEDESEIFNYEDLV